VRILASIGGCIIYRWSSSSLDYCCVALLLLQSIVVVVLLVLQLASHVLSATVGWLSAGAHNDFSSVVHYYGGNCSLLL
jgi:hypothetical protein